LGNEAATQIQLPGASPIARQITGHHDICTDLIAPAANAYTTMYCDLSCGGSLSLHKADPTSHDATGNASPPSVQQADDPPDRIHQIDRNTVRDCDREENSRSGRQMPIEPLEQPPSLPVAMPTHTGAVDLVGAHDSVESGAGRPEAAPALHDRPHRLGGPGPKPEVEPSRSGAPPSDPGEDAKPLMPAWYLQAGNRPRDVHLAEQGVSH